MSAPWATSASISRSASRPLRQSCWYPLRSPPPTIVTSTASRNGPYRPRRVLRRVGEDRHAVEALAVERRADPPDLAVHHPARRHDVGAGAGPGRAPPWRRSRASRRCRRRRARRARRSGRGRCTRRRTGRRSARCRRRGRRAGRRARAARCPRDRRPRCRRRPCAAGTPNSTTARTPRPASSATSLRRLSRLCWTTPGSDAIGCGSVTSSRTNSGAIRSLVRTRRLGDEVAQGRRAAQATRAGRRGRKPGHRRHRTDARPAASRHRGRRPGDVATCATWSPWAAAAAGGHRSDGDDERRGGAEPSAAAQRGGGRAAGEHHGVDAVQRAPPRRASARAATVRYADDGLDAVAQRREPVGERAPGPVGLGERGRGPAAGELGEQALGAGYRRHEVDGAARRRRRGRRRSPARRRRAGRRDGRAAAGPARRGAVRRRHDEPVERREAGQRRAQRGAAVERLADLDQRDVHDRRPEPVGRVDRRARPRSGRVDGDAAPGERSAHGRAAQPTTRRARVRAATARAVVVAGVEGRARCARAAVVDRGRRGTRAASRPVDVGADRQRAPGAELGEERPLDLDRVAGRRRRRRRRAARPSRRRRRGTRRRRSPGRRPARTRRGSSRSAIRSVRPSTSSAATAITIAPSVGHLRRGGWRCCRAARRTRGRAGPRRAGRAGAPNRWRRWRRRRGRPAAGRPARRRRSRRAHERADHEASWATRRQVLGRVHGDVGATVEHGLLDLLDEHALPTDRVQRHVLAAVAGRVDEDELDRRTRSPRPQRVGDGLRLGARLRAAPGRQAQRGTRAQCRSNRSLTAAALRSPCGVPASWRSRTDGPCSSLATMPWSAPRRRRARRRRARRGGRRSARPRRCGPPRPARAAGRRAAPPGGR